MVDQCKVKGLVGHERVIVDSTDMAADTEVLHRNHVRRRAVKKVLKAVAADDAELAREVASDLVKYDPTTPQGEEDRQAKANLDHAIAKVGEVVDSGRLTTAKVRQRLQTARQIAEGARSTTDPEARFGRKGRLGYQQQLAMTEKNEIIIGVRVTHGDEPTADKGYDSGKNRAELQSEGIETNIAVGVPEAEMLKQKGKFSRDDFHLDNQGRLVCPAGKVSSHTKRDADHPYDTKHIYRKKDCKNCPLRDQCTTNQNAGRTVRISDYREIEEAALQQATTPQYQAAMTARTAIEHKQAEEVRYHGLRRARYRGLAYVTIQAILTAVAVNAKRMAALLCPLPARTA